MKLIDINIKHAVFLPLQDTGNRDLLPSNRLVKLKDDPDTVSVHEKQE